MTRVGDPIQVLDRDLADGPLIEAPSMIKSGEGTYVLFYSSDSYATSLYDVRYATSKGPTSGFAKSGTPLLETGAYGLTRPGGASVSADGEHMVFHGYRTQNDVSGTRMMYTAKISVSGKAVRAEAATQMRPEWRLMGLEATVR